VPENGKTGGWSAYRRRIFEMTILPGESLETFECLHRELYEEYSPAEISEQRLVQRLASLYWERDRLDRYMQFKLETRQAELMRQFSAAQSTKRLKSQALKAQEAAVLKKAKEYLDEADGITVENSEQIPAAKYRDPGELFEQIAALPDRPANGRELFLELVEEFSIVERHKQLEQIDATIDRTIKRLLQLKTMKQMYRQLEPKVIAPPTRKKSLPEVKVA
jgi:hypothetical protein